MEDIDLGSYVKEIFLERVMDGVDGFEPPMTESKSVVLPLDDTPIGNFIKQSCVTNVVQIGRYSNPRFSDSWVGLP